MRMMSSEYFPFFSLNCGEMDSTRKRMPIPVQSGENTCGPQRYFSPFWKKVKGN
jgi:hypothetical protein